MENQSRKENLGPANLKVSALCSNTFRLDYDHIEISLESKLVSFVRQKVCSGESYFVSAEEEGILAQAL